MKNIIYIFLFVQIFSCKSYPPTVYDIENKGLVVFLDEKHIINDSIVFEVKNISEQNYYFPLECKQTKLKNKIGILEWDYFYPKGIYKTDFDKDNNEPVKQTNCFESNDPQQKNV